MSLRLVWFIYQIPGQLGLQTQKPCFQNREMRGGDGSSDRGPYCTSLMTCIRCPGPTWWRELTDYQKLFSSLHMHAVAYAHTTHHTQKDKRQKPKGEASNYFNIWFNKKHLVSHTCFCIQSVKIYCFILSI